MSWTHFAPSASTPGAFALFALDKCANCGRTTQAVNGCGSPGPASALLRAGLKPLPAEPPEAYHSDETPSGEACDGCA